MIKDNKAIDESSEKAQPSDSITDTERLDFIEAHGASVGNWIARDSTQGRGFRLYSGTSRDEAMPTAREAIDVAIAKATGKVGDAQ